MKNNYFIFFTILGMMSMSAQVGTNFSEPFAVSTNTDYVDTGSPAVTHVLTNNAGQPSVTFSATATEMGFISTFIPSRTGTAGTSGLTDGDAIGVHDATRVDGETGLSAPWVNGNAFMLEDTDGILRIEFDVVSLAGATSPRFQMEYWFDGTTWEASDGANDRFFVGLEINAGAGGVVTVLDSDGGGLGGGGGTPLDATITENTVNNIDFDLAPYIGSTVKLIIEFDSNGGVEEGFFDTILFTEGTNQTLSTVDVPTPLENAISLFPNPTQGTVNIANYNNTALDNVQFIDANGRIIADYDLGGSTTDQSFDLTNKLSTGIYFVRITSQSKSVIRKLVVR